MPPGIRAKSKPGRASASTRHGPKQPAKSRKGHGRPPNEGQSPASLAPSVTTQPIPKPRKRRRVGSFSEDGETPEELTPRVRFAMLEPQIKRVRKDVLMTKWSTLGEAPKQAVKELWKSIERPVVNVSRDEKKRTEAAAVVGGIRRKLGARLSRWPFPPNTKELHFDYERLLNENRALEAQLTPVLHSIQLTRAEIEKEEFLLRADQERLQTLQSNAKDEELLRRRQAKRSHGLLQALEESPEGKEEFCARAIGLITTPDPDAPSLDSGADEEFEKVSKQLQSHLHSMRGNAEQVKDIAAGLASAQAAVDDALYHHFNELQYSQIVMGP
ncbi:MAG: hypothetical protein M1829_002468 [Trizodia sp. TS-e1964]|nr:MAG: hypothetical protein M1829_002468 [Trizodia sp. TS-e1964]